MASTVAFPDKVLIKLPVIHPAIMIPINTMPRFTAVIVWLKNSLQFFMVRASMRIDEMGEIMC
ncbi:MAG: hypothetical protein D6800_12825 [Candidatus Zixiibacteriota bacterium]|nr:MAG: hypothetical protein D6800_12825 [candidate division Zixibacteria bacterium]